MDRPDKRSRGRTARIDARSDRLQRQLGHFRTLCLWAAIGASAARVAAAQPAPATQDPFASLEPHRSPRAAENDSSDASGDESLGEPEWARDQAQIAPAKFDSPHIPNRRVVQAVAHQDPSSRFQPPVRQQEAGEPGDPFETGVQQARHVQSPEVGPFSSSAVPPPARFGPDMPPPIYHEEGRFPPSHSEAVDGMIVPPPQFCEEQPYCQGAAALPDSDKPFVVPYQTRLVATWLGGSGDDLGMSDFDLSSMLVFPDTKGIAITPGFQVHSLDGPTRTDLPGELYNARVELAVKRPWNRQWSYLVSVAPGIYSDFEASSDSLRVIARALAFYKWSPATELAFGFVYADRENLSVLPAGGIIHVPNPGTRLELLFPRPKLAARIAQGDGTEWWAYVAGEFGGGSWAIERAGGGDDVVTYSDWRALVGVESKFPGYQTVFQNIPLVFVEAGWVFNREIEYKSGAGDYDPDGTALLRAGFVY